MCDSINTSNSSMALECEEHGRIGFRAGMVTSLLYSLVRFVLDLVATSRADRAKLLAEVLVLRRQVQVLERQVKWVRWGPGDRMIMAALRERLPRSAWAGLLVRPETVLGWHREFGAPKVGGLSWSSTPRTAADLRGLPAPDHSDGAREPRLGLLSNSRRDVEAGAPGGGDHDPVGAAGGRYPARRPPIAADLEAVLGRACRNPGSG